MSVKSRLQKRKTWFTLDQAAQRLSDEYNEDITTENVVELALEGDLAISMQVYGAQKVLPLQKGEQVGVRAAPSLSPITGYKPGMPGLPKDVTGHVGEGIYRIGTDAPSTKQHLHRLIGGDSLGTVGTPAWYLIMDDADNGEPHLFIPLLPIKETKLLPFPSPQSLLVRREELEAFISKVGQQSAAPVIDGDNLRTLETFGLLVELYADQHGPDYRHGARPKASRIVQDMLGAIPDDVTGMGDRKLKEHVGAAITAWEAKKRR